MSSKQIRLAVLENQIGRLEKRVTTFRAVSDRYSWVRLAIFVAGVGISIAGFYFVNGWLGWPLLVATLLAYAGLAYRHQLLENGITRHKVWLELKRAQVARIKLDWDNIPPEFAAAPLRADHPFEIDLDITGERSLHRLLDTATSREGSLRLRDWLLTTRPDINLITRRQKLVCELAPLSLFRAKLIMKARLAAGKSGEQWEGSRLLAWLERNAKSQPLRGTLILLSLISLLNIGLFTASMLGLLPNIWVIGLLIFILVSGFKSTDTSDLLGDAYTLRDGLAKLKQVLGYLEAYNYKRTPELQKLCQPLLDNRPTLQLRRISRVLNGLALQRNAILWIIINAFIPWKFYFAYRLDQRKAELAAALPGWLEIWFELESLNSLANFAYLNPEYSYPEVDITHTTPVFEGVSLGHPLIIADKKVSNDFRLDKIGELIIITGSNMAGKSSFLRTLGVNLCLTYAGGPVNARQMRTGLFRIFTCIRVNDSVTDGFSYFYAEVRRLKALLNEVNRADSMPVFFLIDEIFRGTNNRERLIGSRSYLKALLGSRSVGIVSTHDLELVHLADNEPSIKNYHFREDVIDGLMVFDYKLRSGPSPTTNALKIMKLEGLPVEA